MPTTRLYFAFTAGLPCGRQEPVREPRNLIAVNTDGMHKYAAWGVYICRCRDGTLYTGSTARLARRLVQHNAGQGARYTRSRAPVHLVYWEPCASRAAAQGRESALKKAGRRIKLDLIGRWQDRFRRPGGGHQSTWQPWVWDGVVPSKPLLAAASPECGAADISLWRHDGWVRVEGLERLLARQNQAAHRLAACVLWDLRAQGDRGVYVMVPATPCDPAILERFTNLGLVPVTWA